MKKYIFIIAVLLGYSWTNAQSVPFFHDYAWEESPSYKVEDSADEDIVAVLDKTVTEFFYDEEAGLVEYFLEHRVLWLNSDEAIEDFNKIYLPYSRTSKLLVSRARVITNEGEVMDLDYSKILTAEDEESGRTYRFFAFEGVEKGSLIEYLYVVQRRPNYSGKRITFQSYYPKDKVRFDLYSPTNLIFKFKNYNNAPEVEQDTVMTGKLHWKMGMDDLAALEEEDFAPYHASKGFIVYKLDQNTARNLKDVTSYRKVSQNIHAYYYPDHPNRTRELIQKFLTESLGENVQNSEETIRKLELFIKTNVFQSDINDDNLEDLDEVLTNKVANETGVKKLFTAVLSALNIKHELVLTSDREDLKFDKNFEANNFLTDFLIYFPKYRTYLSPTEYDSRYGFPPPTLADNYGLFIKEVKVGNLKSAVGRIKYIKPLEADKSVDRMIIDVAFDQDDLTVNTISLDHSMSGYYAMYFQPYLTLLGEEEQNKILENFAKNLNENVTISDKQVMNGDPESFGVHPFRVTIDFSSESFVEKAGNKYLFKVGELIGPQMQLYQEKERILPVETDFTRHYYRQIKVRIPDGYRVANPEDINIDNAFNRDGKDILWFRSFYEIENDLLTITADEIYKANIIAPEDYDDYRVVINSAADFNKITLILEPSE